MTRFRAIYAPGKGCIAEYQDDVLVWAKGDTPSNRSSIHVIKDLEPHRNMATGEIVSTRRRHREILKDFNLVEIGNEKMDSRPAPISRDKRRQMISQQLGDMSDRQADKILSQMRKDFR